MRLRSFVPIAVALALCVTHSARADETGDLEKGRNAYLHHDYTEADARFRAMLDPTFGTLKSPELVNEARMIWGAVYVAMKRTDDAEALFAKIIRQDAEYQPDPLMFGTDVLDKFTDTQTKLKDEINAQKQKEAQEAAAKKAREAAEKKKQEDRIKLLEQLAGQETITDRHSRFVALMPFGVGQFQNGKPGLGVFFLISQAAFFATGALTTGIGLVQNNQARDFLSSNPWNIPNANIYNQYVRNAETTWVVDAAATGVFAILWIASAIEAEVNYVPQVVTTRPRPLPAAWLAPSLAAEPGRGALSGATLSVIGRF